MFEFLQASQEVQQILLLRRTQRVEVVDHRVGFRATRDAGALRFVNAVGGQDVEQLRIRSLSAVFVAGVVVELDSLHQVGGATVMQEEKTLPESPQRSGAELVGSGAALADAIGEPRAHVVEGKI